MTKTIKAPVSHDWMRLCADPKKAPQVATRVANFRVKEAGIREVGVDFSHPKDVGGQHTPEHRAAHHGVHGDYYRVIERSPFISKMTARLKGFVEAAGSQFRGREEIMPYFSLRESKKGDGEPDILTFRMDHFTSDAQVKALSSALAKNTNSGFEVCPAHAEGDTTEIGLIDRDNNLLLRIRFHVELGMPMS
jgi:hypothetical protein